MFRLIGRTQVKSRTSARSAGKPLANRPTWSPIRANTRATSLSLATTAAELSNAKSIYADTEKVNTLNSTRPNHHQQHHFLLLLLQLLHHHHHQHHCQQQQQQPQSSSVIIITMAVGLHPAKQRRLHLLWRLHWPITWPTPLASAAAVVEEATLIIIIITALCVPSFLVNSVTTISWPNICYH